MDKMPSEDELREWERLAEEATILPLVADLHSKGDRKFYIAARTGWPRTIAALRRANSIIEIMGFQIESVEEYLDAAKGTRTKNV